MPLHWYSFRTLSPCLFLEKLHPSTCDIQLCGRWLVCALSYIPPQGITLEILSLIQQLTQPSFATGLY